jgi:tetratricopeptide (TPR) repeat protein
MRSVAIAIIFSSSSLFAQTALDTGLGDLHVKVNTQNPEAQRWFDQGMRYVYAFNHEAAIASFRHAAELDPDLAIAYWGASLALGPNINLDVDPEREAQAYKLEQTALAHISHASPKERDLINVLAKRYSNDPAADLKKLSAEYSAGMRELHAKYPDDPDIATLYAESLMDLHPWRFWTHEGKPTEGTEEIISVLESVLKKHPHHMGANHYYIHAVEASPHPERALASAKRLTTLAPAAGHLVHMPAHIYQRTGNYSGAAAANVAGVKADREFVKMHGQGMYSMMYYSHNLDFGAASYAMVGQFKEAKELADEMTSNAQKMAKEMAPIEPFISDSLKVLVRFGKWADVITVPDQSAGPISSTFRHYARGVAFAHLGNIEGARAEEKQLAAERSKLTDETGFLQNSGKALAAVMEPLLEGEIAESEGNRSAAIASYRRAVEAEDALNYNEPADWFYPTRETLGAALLKNGDYVEAERVFRDDLSRNPDNPRSLYGLAEALKAQKKPAAKTTAAFKRAWRGDAYDPLR